jgi:DNA-directed RNA polymerase specialized sigma24 family protein
MILHINAKLNQWADWVATGRKVVGLGYPGQCAFMRLTPSTSEWRAPIENEEAWSVERAVQHLEPCLKSAVEQFYLRAGTADTHAKALHCHRDTLYSRIHQAHVRIMEFMQIGDEEKNQLTGSDTLYKNTVR